MPERKTTVYKAIKENANRFGIYYKTCIHLHTLASHDFKLLKSWDERQYRKATIDQIFALCTDNAAILPTLSRSDIDPKIWEPFKSEKDFYAYLLIANELVKNNYGMVLVTDHNAIGGAALLRQAVSYLVKFKSCTMHPHILAGIEITCADRNHVVGYFNENSDTKQTLNFWLEKNLYSISEGVTQTSLEVLRFLRSIGAEGYIAHIDSFNTFEKDRFSGAYKKALLDSESLFGLANLRQKDHQLDLMQQIKKKNYYFVLDNDAHCIEDIGINPIWVKCEKRDFPAIKEAFSNYQTSVLLEEPRKDKKLIEGVYIAHRDGGFLCGKNDSTSPFVLPFSDELNCLIGGRGTGKSTILEMLEYALAQRCESERILEFICRHSTIFVLYYDNGTEYLVEMRTPVKPHNGSILQRFGQNEDDRFYYCYQFAAEEIMKYALTHYVTIYQVDHSDGNLCFKEQSNKKELLRKLFDTRYSINELVKTASSDEISKYLYNILFENKTLAYSSNTISCRSFNGLKSKINDVQDVLDKRAAAVAQIVDPFNASKRGIFRITYSQTNTPPEPYIGTWLGYKENDLGKWYTLNGAQYNLKFGDVIEYLLSIYQKVGFVSFIKICVDRDWQQAEITESIRQFCKEMTSRLVDAGITELKTPLCPAVVSDILARAVNKHNAGAVIDYLKEAMEEIESFSLEFNVNNRESVRTEKVDYRDVRNLSLGQKVVAMLSFVLGYSEYMNDYRPLVIDQPEDNLDNQYIYKTLVRQLREAKSKRQVIIATHNATLVTNTNAEQVCVMESNGDNGWIETSGYVGTPKIKKHIVNYLEGGTESFVHKCEIYHDILPRT